MLSVQFKCAVNGREVSLDRFVTLFLEETIQRAISDAMCKFDNANKRSSSDSIVPQKSQAKPRVVSVEETARILSVSSLTIRRLLKDRKIASVHVARRVMIPTEAIDDLLEKGSVPARR
jgi:excisionase family DNA binding protein